MKAPRNIARVLADALAKIPEAHAGKAWPSTRYQSDPLGFVRDILGVELWKFQRQFMLALVEHRHIAVAGGRKIGKDFVVGCAALWWYASFPRARVILLAPSSKQLDEILYREIMMLWDGAGRCVACKKRDPEGPRPCQHSAVLTGRKGTLARTGIRSNDYRQIIGITAVNEGGLRGLSGSRILAIEDEASDIKDEFDTALVGNLAAAEDCRRVLISNPVHGYGFFFRAFHEEKHLYKCFTQSTADNPNVTSGKRLFPGLADATWLKDRELAWGKGTAPWLANVEGKFPRAEAGQLFTLDMVADAQRRHKTAPNEGRLAIGIDPAGEGRDGDETGIAVRRGMKCKVIEAARGMTADGILHRVLALIDANGLPFDLTDEDMRPVVVIDRDGAEGARVYKVFQEYNWTNPRVFKLMGFRGAEPPFSPRLAETYRLCRDALYGGLLDWLRLGGTLPEELKLEGELYAMRWVDHVSNKQVLVSKSDLRSVLGRSPDRADALALSTWGPGVAVIPAEAVKNERARLDPYDVVRGHDKGEEFDVFGGDEAFDPYA
jgi:phage terminase large subunit